MRPLLAALLIAGLGICVYATQSVTQTEAAIGIFRNFQCKDGKVTLLLSWTGGDPGAREHWIDLTATNNN